MSVQKRLPIKYALVLAAGLALGAGSTALAQAGWEPVMNTLPNQVAALDKRVTALESEVSALRNNAAPAASRIPHH
jgi:outer membrane murein-binding lipoprotein Lpp